MPTQQNHPTLVVGRVDTASAIGASTGLLRKSAVFATAGGVQFIDATGAVITLGSGTGASLTANNTFTGKNTFDPLAASGVALGTPSLLLDLGNTQTLAAGTIATVQAALSVLTPAYTGTAPGSTVGALATLYIEGAPSAGTLTVSDTSYAILVEAGMTSLDELMVQGAATLNGSLTFDADPSTFVTKAADLTIDLTGAATRTLSVLNSTGAEVCNLTVDGTITTGSTLTLSGAGGTIARSAGNLTISTATPAVLSLSVGNAGSLQLGGNAAALMGFFGAAPAARPTGVAVSDAAIHAALVTLGLITA